MTFYSKTLQRLKITVQ